MGLDMNLYATDKSLVVSSTEVTSGDLDEIGYWRKFWPLHERIEQMYNDKGGTDTFNCVPVVLDETDLDVLLDFINEYATHELDEYGNTTEYAVRVFNNAKQAIANGFAIYYSAWY